MWSFSLSLPSSREGLQVPLAGDNQRKQQRSRWASSCPGIWWDAQKEGKPVHWRSHELVPKRLPAPPEHNSYMPGFHNTAHTFAVVMKMHSDLKASDLKDLFQTWTCHAGLQGGEPWDLASLPCLSAADSMETGMHWVRHQTPSLWALNRLKTQETSSWKHARREISMPQIPPFFFFSSMPFQPLYVTCTANHDAPFDSQLAICILLVIIPSPAWSR